MSEREAWDLLALAWERPDYDGYLIAVKVTKYSYAYGLCDCIKSMCNDGKISYTVAEIMLRKVVEKQPNLGRGTYKWPLSREGAAARAAFCRRMAAELEVEA